MASSATRCSELRLLFGADEADQTNNQEKTMSGGSIAGFKAYDLRGRVPSELNEDVAYRIGRAYAEFLKPRRVAVGRDIRLSSEEIARALEQGLLDSGVDVHDIGLCGTEAVYFATFSEGLDGGIMVTASHNPPDYNGMKFVREQSKPISGDTGLQDIRRIAEKGEFSRPSRLGERFAIDIMPSYIEHLLTYVDVANLRPLKIVAHAGNGGAGLVIDKLEPYLPFEFIKVDHEPDGEFPNGVPNPMLVENHRAPVEALLKHKADLAISWDGDFDRCFLFDENATFIEGYYIVGLLASMFLRRHPGSKIVHDPRLTWNTLDIVEKGGGQAVQSKSGHAFIKQRMREVDGIYGGEMSAHHYFRDFAYCDSGMIPWLLVTQLLSESGKPLSQLVGERMRLFPASGEINRRVDDTGATIDRILSHYRDAAVKVDFTDGVSLEFERWRFNLRASNTEPLIRLNVESRGDEKLMRAMTAQVLELVGGEPG
jgi:phosphomannomutase